MNFRRLLNTDLGHIFISIMLGMGLATLFHRSCTGNKCLEFNGPVISEVDGKIYKFNDYCHKYEMNPVSCNATKKIIQLS